jgi:glycosyltransferase involved in cell wall biosynthesis
MPQKAYDRMVRLAYHLKKNNVDVDFWILGTGYLEAELRRLARDLSVEDMVHFLGFKSNPYPYIAASDLFLSTSMTEGYPLVICEALCLGKPIIATAVSGSKEILADSEYGLLSEEDDDSLLKNTLRMITNNSLREYYSNRAVEKSLDFDVQSTVDNIYKFIKQ